MKQFFTNQIFVKTTCSTIPVTWSILVTSEISCSKYSFYASDKLPHINYRANFLTLFKLVQYLTVLVCFLCNRIFISFVRLIVYKHEKLMRLSSFIRERIENIF